MDDPALDMAVFLKRGMETIEERIADLLSIGCRRAIPTASAKYSLG